MADTDSTIVDTHSRETRKVSAIASETLSTIVWNRCPPSIGIGVRNPSEYAVEGGEGRGRGAIEGWGGVDEGRFPLRHFN